MGIDHIRKRNRCWSFSIYVFIAIICALVNVSYAQEGLKAKRDKSFLWSIETEKNRVYLLGSVHLLKSDSYPLAKEIERAYDDCQKVVFETDIDGLNKPDLQAKMMSLGLYPNGQSLKQNISEHTYELIKRKITAAGLPMAQFDRFKPWFGGIMLTVMELQRLGFDPNYGIDMYFFKKAKKDKKALIFLESNEYQLNLFAGLDKLGQESFLMQTLKQLEVIEKMFSDMVKAWKIGDADRLDSMLNKSFKEHPDIYNHLVVQRNRDWIPKIENLINQKDNVLIIVGAGHLTGAESVLELLKMKGYKMEQR